MIGQLLAGHYRVLQVLGAGGFGQTYIVEDIHLPGDPKCVLKHLKPASTDPKVLETARKLFQREAETLQKLGNHKQIPRLLAYFEEDQEFYLVQEFIDGNPLGRELSPGVRWTESQIIEMLLEILSILEVVHSQGVIHRDIKPDNIIRRASDNKFVLIDFGAIKEVRNPTLTGTGHSITIAIGTPGYMPTEQGKGRPRPSSDIYALGMMSIQILTGVHPNKLQEDLNTGEILWQDKAAVSQELANFLNQMTRYHFKDRYQSASEALQALKEILNPSETPTIQTTTTISSLHELTLEWQEAGKLKNQTIFAKQPSKSPTLFYVGRDPQSCDIVLSDSTLQARHAEIFFDPRRQNFYLRSLDTNNPLAVNGQHFSKSEVMLAQGSTVRLGQSDLKVNAITLKLYPADYTPKQNGIQYKTEPQQLLGKTTQQIRTTRPQQQRITPVTGNSYSQVPRSPRKWLMLMGMGVPVILTTIGGFSLLNRNPGTQPTQKSLVENLISKKPELCRIVSPTKGNETAKLRRKPSRDVSPFSDINKGVKVLFVKTADPFVEVKLDDRTGGWVFNDQIKTCNGQKSPKKSSSKTSASSSSPSPDSTSETGTSGGFYSSDSTTEPMTSGGWYSSDSTAEPPMSGGFSLDSKPKPTPSSSSSAKSKPKPTPSSSPSANSKPTPTPSSTVSANSKPTSTPSSSVPLDSKPTPTPSSSPTTNPNPPANTAYNDGLNDGSTHGHEAGQQDGSAIGRDMYVDGSCSKDGSQDAEYNRGFEEGCKQAYREAFANARQEAIQKQESEAKSKIDNHQNAIEPDKGANGIYDCPPSSDTPGCEDAARGQPQQKTGNNQ